MLGVNAAVVGLLGAAFYDPIWIGGIRTPPDLALGLAAFVLLAFWKVPPWAVVILGALAGWGIGALARLNRQPSAAVSGAGSIRSSRSSSASARCSSSASSSVRPMP